MKVVIEAVVMFVALYNTCDVTDVQTDSSDWF